MSLELGALTEPLAVAAHALQRGKLSPASTVLILGAGAIGLFTAAMARLHHSAKIIIADIDDDRLEFAFKHGFADEIHFMPTSHAATDEEILSFAQETADEIARDHEQRETTSRELDAVFECTGVPSCVQTAIYVCLILVTSTFIRYLTDVSRQLAPAAKLSL